MAKTKEQLLNILDQFQLTEKVVSAEPFGNGHINDTLKVTNEKRRNQIRAATHQPPDLHKCGYVAEQYPDCYFAYP